MKRYIFLLSFLALICKVFAQNSGLELVRVEFWAPAEGIERWIVIRQDGFASKPISGTTKTKTWELGNTGVPFKKPAAYVSGSKPRLAACFRENGVLSICPTSGSTTNSLVKRYARGIVLDVPGMTLPIKQLLKTGTAQTYEYTVEPVALGFLPDKVQYFEKFRVKWEWSMSEDGNGVWEEAGISENTLYVTLQKPKLEEPIKGYAYFHTLIDIGCKQANGATDFASLLAGVWGHFSGRSVKRVDGTLLTYYGNWAGGNLATTTASMLLDNDGMCMAWTRLFLDVLKVQGLKEEDNFIVVRPRASNGFFVKNWVVYSGNGTSGNPLYPYKNIKGIPFYAGNNYNWDYAEVYIGQPMPSQNNVNPQSDFGSHIFARVNGVLYDPSYGVVYGISEVKNVPTLDDPDIFEMVKTVSVLDNEGISAYYLIASNPLIYNIQMNPFELGDFIVIVNEETY